jgi:hypothetical protein
MHPSRFSLRVLLAMFSLALSAQAVIASDGYEPLPELPGCFQVYRAPDASGVYRLYRQDESGYRGLTEEEGGIYYLALRRSPNPRDKRAWASIAQDPSVQALVRKAEANGATEDYPGDRFTAQDGTEWTRRSDGLFHAYAKNAYWKMKFGNPPVREYPSQEEILKSTGYRAEPLYIRSFEHYLQVMQSLELSGHLRRSLDKAITDGDEPRAASLRAEVDRRFEAINEYRARTSTLRAKYER